MSWEKEKNIYLEFGFESLNCDAYPWVFRCFDEIVGVAKDSTIQWKFEFEDDHMFGHKTFVCAQGLVIASAHRKKDPKNIWLNAIERETGRQVWERKINWKLTNNLGGLLSVDDLLILQEYAKSDVRLLFLSAATGELLLETTGERTQSDGLGQRDAHSAAVVGKYAYFYKRKFGLYRAAINPKKSKLKLYNEVSIVNIAYGKDSIYYLVWSNPLTIVWQDGITGKEHARFQLPLKMDIQKIVVLPHSDNPRIALLLKDKKGVSLLDFKKNRLLWQQGQNERWNVFSATWTPYGLIIVVETKEGDRAYCLDEMTGELCSLSQFEGDEYKIAHWTGQELVLGTSSGAEIYRWQSQRLLGDG